VPGRTRRPVGAGASNNTIYFYLLLFLLLFLKGHACQQRFETVKHEFGNQYTSSGGKCCFLAVQLVLDKLSQRRKGCINPDMASVTLLHE